MGKDMTSRKDKTREVQASETKVCHLQIDLRQTEIEQAMARIQERRRHQTHVSVQEILSARDEGRK
jgi:hypothetical protein